MSGLRKSLQKLSIVLFFFVPCAASADQLIARPDIPIRLHLRRATTASSVSPARSTGAGVHILGDSQKGGRKSFSGGGASNQPKVPEPLTLMATKVGSDIALSWTGSSGLFRISYSPDPSFQDQVQTLADELPDTSAVLSTHFDRALECYDVTDAQTASPAVQGMGYDPLPLPEVDSVTSNCTEPWWGCTVTVNGFYLDTIAPENIMFFYHRPQRASLATINPPSAYATSATFTIPEDARSGPVTIETGGGTNQSGEFIALSPPGVGPYTSIRNVTYSNSIAPETGNIWVAADNIVQEIDVFRGPNSSPPNPQIITTIPGYTKPYISRMTSDRKILLVDGILGHPEILQIDVLTGTTSHYANTTTAAFTRNIQPVGIAVSHNRAFAYIADAAAGKIVRVPLNNTTAITDNFGNFTWQFPDPCGMDAIDNNFVYASDTRQFIGFTFGSGLTCWPESETCQSGVDTSPEVMQSFEIDWDISGAEIWATWNTLPTATSYNVNPIGTTTNVWRTGGFVEGRPDGKLELDPLLFNAFALPDFPPAQVIINNTAAVNAGITLGYPSPNQTADRLLKVDVQGPGGLSVYLQLLDPPDLAAYAPIDLNDPSTWTVSGALYPYHAHDNRGLLEEYGLLDSNGDPQTFVIVPTDNFGNATAYLKVPDRYAGDNFQIAVYNCSTYTSCPTNKLTYLTYIHTSWKRVLVERDKMFKKGGVLSSSFDTVLCVPDCNVINLFSGANVELSDEIAIFDETPTNTYESGNAEIRTVNSLATNGDGSIRVQFALPLSKNHLASNDDGGTPATPVFANGHSAGVGVTSNCDKDPNQVNATNSCFYESDMRSFEQAYDDGFVQLLGARQGMNTLPFLHRAFFDSGPENKNRFHQIWFAHKIPLDCTLDGGPNCVGCCNQPHDYWNLLGESEMPDTGGITYPGSDSSFVFFKTIKDEVSSYCAFFTCDGSEVRNNVQHTSIHEIGHQFNVNSCNAGGHDSNVAWCGNPGGFCATDLPPACGSSEWCLMHASTDDAQYICQKSNRVFKFDCSDLSANPACSVSDCSGTGGISIRTDFEPE